MPLTADNSPIPKGTPSPLFEIQKVSIAKNANFWIVLNKTFRQIKQLEVLVAKVNPKVPFPVQ